MVERPQLQGWWLVEAAATVETKGEIGKRNSCLFAVRSDEWAIDAGFLRPTAWKDL